MQLGAFEQKIMQKAKTFHSTICLPESRDPRVFAAAMYLLESSSVAQIYLFLTENELNELCRKAGVALEAVRDKILLMPEQNPGLEDKTYQHIITRAQSKNKKVAENELLTIAKNPLYQAGYLTASGLSALTVAGASYTTAEVLRAGLATIPLQAGISTISSSFLLIREGKAAGQEELLLFADCGVIVEPTSVQLADIAEASSRTWQRLMGPTVPAQLGFLSFASKGSAVHPSLEVLREGLRLFRKRCPEILCDGELQFDAAYDREVGLKKCPDSPVAGKVNVCIFPNLAAGNIAYKITQRLGNFAAYGPLLQGFSAAYSDLSRGCSSKDIVMSVYINIILAIS